MSKKNRLKELHAKLKKIADRQLVHDAELHESLKELENEIKSTQDEGVGDDGGGNSPEPPDVP